MDTLESLVREVVAEQPKNQCAENGSDCIFCWEHYKWSYQSGGSINHSPDCWLKRAEKVLAELKETK